MGSYELEERIETRGLCHIYRGVHRHHGDLARIKVANAVAVAVEDSILREAALLSRISHPGVARLLESGAYTKGRHYLATEPLEGETVDLRVRRGTLHLQEVLHIGQALCVAMAAVHRQRIAHRDLSPRTVVLAPQRSERGYRPVVMHFDVAEDLDQPRLEVVAGTPMYMAPEQMRGGPVDGRTDIYLLGHLLFVMLARRPLFEGIPFPARIAAATTGEPRVRTGRWIPKALASVLDRCLEYAPEKRYSSMAELEHALKSLETNQASPGLR